MNLVVLGRETRKEDHETLARMAEEIFREDNEFPYILKGIIGSSYVLMGKVAGRDYDLTLVVWECQRDEVRYMIEWKSFDYRDASIRLLHNKGSPVPIPMCLQIPKQRTYFSKPMSVSSYCMDWKQPLKEIERQNMSKKTEVSETSSSAFAPFLEKMRSMIMKYFGLEQATLDLAIMKNNIRSSAGHIRETLDTVDLGDVESIDEGIESLKLWRESVARLFAEPSKPAKKQKKR